MRRKLSRVGKETVAAPVVVVEQPAQEQQDGFVIVRCDPTIGGERGLHAYWVEGYYGEESAERMTALYTTQGVRIRCGDRPYDVNAPLTLPATFVIDFNFRMVLGDPTFIDGDRISVGSISAERIIANSITPNQIAARTMDMTGNERTIQRDQAIREAFMNTPDTVVDDDYEVMAVIESGRHPDCYYVSYRLGENIRSSGHFRKISGRNVNGGTPLALDPETLHAIYTDATALPLRMLPKPPERVNITGAYRTRRSGGDYAYIIEGYYGDRLRPSQINHDFLFEGTYDNRGQLLHTHSYTLEAPPRISLRDAAVFLDRS